MDDPHAPAVPRPAATVLVLRDDPFEVLIVRRHANGPFASALVFPGGLVDPDDHDEAWLPLVVGAEALSADDRALAIAAFRETFEETGLLLTRPAGRDGPRPRPGSAATGFRAVVAASGGLLPVDDLIHFGHWITPEMAPKRFDTHFFLARAPHDQEAVCDGFESVALEWIAPKKALARAAAGDVSFLFPTRMNLKRLAESADTAAAFAAARARPRFTVTPVAQRGAGGVDVVIPAEAGYGETGHFYPRAPKPA